MSASLENFRGTFPMPFMMILINCRFSAYQVFEKAKICDDGLVLGLSQFPLLPQLPQKTMLTSKVVKTDSIIIITSWSKFVTHAVQIMINTLYKKFFSRLTVFQTTVKLGYNELYGTVEIWSL